MSLASNIRELSFIFVWLLVLAPDSSAQFHLSSNTYTQNFDGLGTASVTASDGNLNAVSSGLNGWYFLEAGTSPNTTITANSGSSSTSDTYNYGASGGADRSLGGLTGVVSSSWGFWFSNKLGVPITSLSISYTVETWRVGATNRSDSIKLGVSDTATSLTGFFTENPSHAFSNSPSAITSNGSTSGIPVQTATVSNTISVFIPANGTCFLKWSDVNVTGIDDGMSIDNFSLTAATRQTASQVNWTGGSAPWSTGFGETLTNGRALYFSGGGGNASNDLSSLQVDSVTFGENAGAYT